MEKGKNRPYNQRIMDISKSDYGHVVLDADVCLPSLWTVSGTCRRR